jgi:translin
MQHLNKVLTKKLKKHFLTYALKRRDIIKTSGDALHHAKRAIFAMHRDDMTEAKTKLVEAQNLIKSIQKKYSKDQRAQNEGSLREALEEYVEATLFYQFLSTGKIGEIKNLPIPEEQYVAGLCDVPGELLRYAIKAATEKDIETVAMCAEASAEIVGELIEFDLTKYLRNKFDQAKGAVRKMEYVVYELSLRVKSS